MPAPDGISSSVTRNEFDWSGATLGSYAHRKENKRGGTDSTTVNGTTNADSSPWRPNVSSPVLPGAGSSSVASSGHHSRRCSGRLTTSKTTSGEAST